MGWFRPVHAKSPGAQEIRALLVARKLLQAKLLDIEFGIRGILRGFGLKMGEVRRSRFAERVRELAAGHAMLERLGEPMPRARETLRTQYGRLHREMLARSSGCGRPFLCASVFPYGRFGLNILSSPRRKSV
jgi:transposase